MKIAALALTRGGQVVAKKIKKSFPAGEVDLYFSKKLEGQFPGTSPGEGACYFQESLQAVVKEIFSQYRALIFVMATGIVVRVLGPLLRDKTRDPAVLVLDEGGNYIISLLSGHLGGANELALQVAEKIGAEPVITTATDVRKKPALEMVARKYNMEVEPSQRIKEVNWALVNNIKIKFFKERGLALPPGFPFQVEEMEEERRAGVSSKGKGDYGGNPVVIITSRLHSPEELSDFYPGENFLFLRPRDLVLGVGCKRGISGEELLSFIEKSFQEEGFSLKSLRRIVSVELKREEKGLMEVAQRLGKELAFYSPGELREKMSLVSFSPFVEETTGTGAVCEPAALLGAGREELLWKKKRFKGMTTAAARLLSGWWE
ncbi:MAG: hypothetical protein D5R97_09240 [Candidatus Syntrophonatronum acetioxidans]|uniref:Cobalamin biosynthesis protein CbiG n=1 Tax=Candidatus Syntrophonatronum acetioxidans TaxID=1795816 RepID=A0A424YAJ7_9FIRM|nr:MAG: hypothetical protein D5R97_09240 [Candidatus Syntrophonatronum acetioxidans]